ncbi:MAG: hypothetical protein AABX80_00660 [Nanoarchaeota archaeon]
MVQLMDNNIDGDYYLNDMHKAMCEANKKGQVTKQIDIAEKAGYYFLAGSLAKIDGLFKRAYENFKKIKDIDSYIENINELNEIVFPKYFLTIKEIKITEKSYGRRSSSILYKERLEYKNGNKHFDKKINNDLMRQLVKFQSEGNKFSPNLIRPN